MGILRPEYVVERPECEFPETVVCEFSETIIQEIIEKYQGKRIGRLISVGGDITIYKIFYKTIRIAVCQVMVGGPACVSNLEELIALGAKKFLYVVNVGYWIELLMRCTSDYLN